MKIKKIFKFIYFLLFLPFIFFIRLLFLPFIFFIRLLSFFYVIRFGSLFSTRIGHFVGVTSLYLCEKYYKINIPSKKYSDFFFLDYPIANKQIAKFFQRKLKILPFFLRPLMELNNLIPGGHAHDIYYRKSKLEHLATWQHRDVHNLLDKTPPLVSFSKKEIEIAQNQMKSIGIEEKDDIVLLLVRDEGYLKKSFPNSFKNRAPKIQNAKIDDFFMAVENLIKKNIKVVRIGRDNENFLNYENKNYIDLDKSKKRTDILETYLIYKCKFILGSFTGGCISPFWLFRKPTIFTNYVPIGKFHTNSEKLLIIFKMHYFKKEKRFLNISEIFDNNLANSENVVDYEKKGIDLKDNTAEEIDLATQEMLEKVKKSWKDDNEIKKIKEDFLKVYKKNIKKHNYFQNFHGKKILPTISSSFLKIHKDIIN